MEKRRHRPGSLRWWFEHRHTGELTVAQVPNWPLVIIAVLWVLRRFLVAGSSPDQLASVLTTGLWLLWAGDELIRGVNPWRRLLGAVVIGWQLYAIFT